MHDEASTAKLRSSRWSVLLRRFTLLFLPLFAALAPTAVTVDILLAVLFGPGAVRIKRPWLWSWGIAALFAGVTCVLYTSVFLLLRFLNVVRSTSPIFWIGIVPIAAVTLVVVPPLLTSKDRLVRFRHPRNGIWYSIHSVPLFADQCVHILRQDESDKMLAFAVACESPSTLYVLGWKGNGLWLRLYTDENRLGLPALGLWPRKPEWQTIEVRFDGPPDSEPQIFTAGASDGLENVAEAAGRNFLVSFGEG